MSVIVQLSICKVSSIFLFTNLYLPTYVSQSVYTFINSSTYIHLPLFIHPFTTHLLISTSIYSSNHSQLIQIFLSTCLFIHLITIHLCRLRPKELNTSEQYSLCSLLDSCSFNVNITHCLNIPIPIIFPTSFKHLPYLSFNSTPRFLIPLPFPVSPIVPSL